MGEIAKMSKLVVLMGCFLALGHSVGAQEKAMNPDQRAFQRARLASTAGNWTAAIAILERIDVDKLNDVEVIEFVDFSLRCAKTAHALGVPMKANPTSPTDVIAKIDWGTLIANLVQSPRGALRLLAEARQIQQGIGRYQELDARLLRKFSN